MTIQMIALKATTYAGKRIAQGKRFEVRGKSDARLLEAIGSAVPWSAPPVVVAPPPPAPPAPQVAHYRRKTIEHTAAPAPEVAAQPAAEPAPPAEASEQPKPKRHYTRRDLTAEG